MHSFIGSGAVLDPDKELIEGRTNKDFFVNFKAQSWWALRMRFQATYRAVKEGMEFDPEEIISIPSTLPELNKLTGELSQPTYKTNNNGKILVDKKPDGTKSPNLADALMINFSPNTINSGATTYAAVQAVQNLFR